ncbi:MAG TPA: glutamine synthetase type III [Lachnospiraceae bacterium]|nr:glutamine synthetase III [uncultured Lachnoclostridium sp.]HAU87113.1 glutamine synthetase type III [Lachnospiraceae bacterium]
MKENIKDIYGLNVFDDATMQERLPKKAYDSLKKTMNEGKTLQPEVAEIVANAIKDWAIEKGATHYTHWFQPMTGITAEKQDAFINPMQNGKVILEFSGKELVKGEPDASSFPNGGLRSTFEARGYTAWDCTSPVFIKEDKTTTLCIPTAFCSYTGEALDMKTPLLRSMEAINKQATRILRLLGDTQVKSVTPSVGAEQEYFIVSKDAYKMRDDLKFCGRTLFGAQPPKGQEMEDHYFGRIKDKILEFMDDVNNNLWKMGVPAKTQHNEVAPGQHELAPIFASANVATDHNQLIMETLKRIADHHNLKCLLHEKPFAEVNGSGKHNNWSLVTDYGKNLLNPGKTPHENVQFLVFLSAIIAAVDKNVDLLRVSSANAGNDYRLGAQEAPPVIISVFVGEQLEDVIAQIIETGEAHNSKQPEVLDTGVHTMPSLKKDDTDRNRTSPFAFTGNKFEFRSVPSSASIADCNIVLNTIVAEELSNMSDQIEKSDDVDKTVHDLIKKLLYDHQKIIFNGDGYAKEWVEEAERRGIPNIKSTVDAIPALVTDKAIHLFEKHEVYNQKELNARKEIMYETYSKTINIEARTMISMVSVQYIPAVTKFTRELADTINSIKQAAPNSKVNAYESILNDSVSLINEAYSSLHNLNTNLKRTSEIGDSCVLATYFRDVIIPIMQELRSKIDKLEEIVDKEYWPVPSYSDMLYFLS